LWACNDQRTLTNFFHWAGDSSVGRAAAGKCNNSAQHRRFSLCPWSRTRTWTNNPSEVRSAEDVWRR
ncbi:unnamed protein product, partial [Calicophoron daubneyi]